MTEFFAQPTCKSPQLLAGLDARRAMHGDVPLFLKASQHRGKS
jgi:hypothetical protein